MSRSRALREILIAVVTILAIYHAGRSISGSIERQAFLQKESVSLKSSTVQSQQVNKELRDDLTNYRSSSGIERLARERLNLAGPDEVIVRIGK
jgi:cell division protein FtsB